MHYFLTGVSILLFTLSSYAATFTSKIESIEKGRDHEQDLVLMENGRTAFLDKEKTKKLSLDKFKKSEQMLKVTLDENLNILSIKAAPEKKYQQESEFKEFEEDNEIVYKPSIVTYDQAKEAFDGMRRDYQTESQCYNRAHVWSYEEYKRSKMITSKLFIFFTRRYIRDYRYKWWFHVTPIAHVNGSSSAYWRTLDRRFSEFPLKLKTWSDMFMKNQATCPIVSRYSDYSNNQYAEDCYLIKTSMYFWQPRDIDRYERTGYYKKQFFTREINHAYWEAF